MPSDSNVHLGSQPTRAEETVLLGGGGAGGGVGVGLPLVWVAEDWGGLHGGGTQNSGRVGGQAQNAQGPPLACATPCAHRLPQQLPAAPGSTPHASTINTPPHASPTHTSAPHIPTAPAPTRQNVHRWLPAS